MYYILSPEFTLDCKVHSTCKLYMYTCTFTNEYPLMQICIPCSKVYHHHKVYTHPTTNRMFTVAKCTPSSSRYLILTLITPHTLPLYVYMYMYLSPPPTIHPQRLHTHKRWITLNRENQTIHVYSLPPSNLPVISHTSACAVYVSGTCVHTCTVYIATCTCT